MAKASTTCALRLAASLLALFLLAIPHLALSAATEAHRSRPEAVASKPYVDDSTGRVKLLRPARVQVRVSRNQDFSRGGKSDFSKDLCLAPISADASSSLPMPQHPRVVSKNQPLQVLVRTRNPRDPPR
jgi:hypothetical protein